MEDQERLVKYLVSVEKLANEILSDKHEIVLLDKRRNQNREALRDLTKSTQKKCWVTVGSVLIKHSADAAKSLLEADQKQINIDINKLRSELKVKVNNLRDLEMQPPIPGLMLNPLSSKETEALSSSNLINS
ncbi:hypothetical protein PYW08_014019 [Mythimna loreyi]|uniref:Uncharacterized protein n=1 Tax=Mythimna loreyi TaxID=667449 RepID=A0ACC2R8Z2_9NEOP|nr:hypothetical protein PYW08_014019 [Mythimna loreyi]